MNLSNAELIEKSLSRISLNAKIDHGDEDFAWMDTVPSGLQFAINM